MTNKNIPEIQTSTDYSLFEFLPTNRIPTKKHIAELTSSIMHDNRLRFNPGQVNVLPNGHYGLIDGQTRFLVAKANNLPFYFIIDKSSSIVEARLMNKYTKPWIIMNFIDSYAAEGHPDYIWFREAMINNGMSYSMLMIFVLGRRSSGDDSFSRKMKAGSFAISPAVKQRTEARLKKYERITPYFSQKGVPTQAFQLMIITHIDDPEWDTFVSQLEKQGKSYNYPKYTNEADVLWAKIMG